MSLTKLFLAGNNLSIPGRESLVSDIPAGDGKTANLFFTVYHTFPVTYFRRAAVLVRELFAPGWGDVPGIHALVLYAGTGLVFLALSCTIGCRNFNILKYMFCKKIRLFPSKNILLSPSVADTGCLSRIPDPDFYPSWIPDPGSKNSNKREGWKNLLT